MGIRLWAPGLGFRWRTQFSGTQQYKQNLFTGYASTYTRGERGKFHTNTPCTLLILALEMHGEVITLD